jgi:hypothetical protein
LFPEQTKTIFLDGRIRVGVGDITHGTLAAVVTPTRPCPVAAVALRSMAEFLDEDGTIKAVRLVFFSKGDMNVFLHNHQFVS